MSVSYTHLDVYKRQALLVIADALVMKMAAERGAPESELFTRHANLE